MIEALRKSFEILTSSAKRKFVLLSVGQALLSVFDLFGILMVGAIGAIGIRGVGGAEAGDRVSQVLNLMRIGGFTLTQQIAILGGFAASLLTAKTILSAIITRKTYDFLSQNCAELTTLLLNEIIKQTRDIRNARNSQELLFAVNEGARIIVVAILGAGTSLLADLSLILILCFGLALVNFQVALVSIGYFSLVAVLIYVMFQRKVLLLGGKMTKQQIRTSQEILELLTASREISVSGKTDYYINRIREAQSKSLQTFSNFTFVPLLGKYIIEGSLVFGALLLGYLEFRQQDPYRAIASISVFIAAGTRMAPALLRLQNSALLIKGSMGATVTTFDLIEELNHLAENPVDRFQVSPAIAKSAFIPHVKFTNVGFTYEGDNDPIIPSLNFQINQGECVALVGSSGSGKSTILDLILGILEPQDGKIEISGEHPRHAISSWPGQIGYVPQQVGLFNRRLAENIGIGIDQESLNYQRIAECLNLADLETMVSELEDGLETILQESGNNLSGGQKQRIGLARALYTKPSLLILDEATSALDAQSEARIISELRKRLAGSTLLIVTHRVSIAKSADSVIYLEKGQIKAKGSFDQIKKKVPDFEAQAALSGL